MAELAEVVEDTLQSERVSIWLRDPIEMKA